MPRGVSTLDCQSLRIIERDHSSDERVSPCGSPLRCVRQWLGGLPTIFLMVRLVRGCHGASDGARVRMSDSRSASSKVLKVRQCAYDAGNATTRGWRIFRALEPTVEPSHCRTIAPSHQVFNRSSPLFLAIEALRV